MRSLLFVPGDSERKLEKSLQSGADILIVDLEDSVAAGNKEDARRIAAEFIADKKAGTSSFFYVRVNDLSTGLTDEDLEAMMAVRPDGIILPKAQGGQDVTHLAAKLRVHEAEQGIEDGTTRILPIITETASGVLAASTYREASPRLSGITWGAEDLSADIGARTARDEDGRFTDTFRIARAMTILAAASAEVAAVDTVFPNFRDEGGFRRECVEAERDGFTAKMAIHPAQVPIINEAFTPSAEAVAHSKAVIDAFSAAGNPGVVAIDGQMYDRPHLRRAERILARAKAAGA
ncbi:citrate lyase subunit beta/citryl-CoA lyase [Mesorhizobium sp. J18]|uniref:HpcH/HpaI aldolase/citrate lyase family protein n=1 Tax=Mesorhizobium sp. J18 TaxID=935263 RepID=UPI00119980A9|nr:CoA ester lyase [Mesorhizobium sp. J18]TWG94127.1 citrate lyase subunit beta/citryl-CoA lyase [Mesorhizobium sp. J18]